MTVIALKALSAIACDTIQCCKHLINKHFQPLTVFLYAQHKLKGCWNPAAMHFGTNCWKAAGVVWKNFALGRVWSRGIFRRQTRRRSPRVFLRKILRHSGSPEGEVFQTTPRLFNSLSDFGFLEVQGQTCPRALYGKSSRKPQWSLYTVNPRLHR